MSIEALINEGTTIETRKGKYVLFPATWRQLKSLLAFIAIVQKNLPNGMNLTNKLASEPSDPSDSFEQPLFDLLLSNQESIIELAAGLSSIPKDDLEEMLLDDVLTVLVTLIQVNFDFFVKALVPKLGVLGPQIKQLMTTFGNQSL